MAQTLYGQGIINPIIKDLGITDDDYEIVRLSVGSDIAVVGDFLSYDGQITAATATTHRDVTLAAAVSADNQVANAMQGWCGQLIEPIITPDPVAGVAWTPAVALLDGTLVKMLKRGARCTTAAICIDVAGHDFVLGEMMCIATAGVCKTVINTLTDTTPTTPELALMLIQLTSEFIGRMAEVSEDISDELVVFIDWGVM